MPDVASVATADLAFDEENPRLGTPNEGQRAALRAMATVQGAKVRALAEDILEYGLDPSELPIVMKVEGNDSRFVVLDGNRRLTAIRSLENPESIADAVPPKVLNAIRRLSKRYLSAPIESVDCLVVKDRDEADHWIELRHTGERGGAGPVQWGSDESSRFRARRFDASEIHTQALDFLEGRGDITAEFRSTIPASSYRRLLGTPAVRARLGLDWSAGQLVFRAPENDVARALLYVAKDIAGDTPKIKVRDIYTREQRVDYANDLPTRAVVAQSKQTGRIAAPGALGRSTSTGTPQAGSPQRPAKPRDRLIGQDCVLTNVDPQRLRDIERELRLLSLENHTNAVSVLFRVFMELSADAYIGAHTLVVQGGEMAPLGTKLNVVTIDLVARKKLTGQQAKPMRRAAQANSYLGPSHTTMHQWVHNPYMIPGPSDLRSDWDSLQSWFVAVWSA